MARDIGKWLVDLGLGKYADAFAENEINFDALPHVTEEDLREIGVALGARRTLLAAIVELVDSDQPETADERSDDRSTGAEAERRQLTVMFVDMVGSTALSAELDPEDLREIMRRYQDAVAGAVTRYGGYVAKYLGDGVLAYFGWPQAHEDQAERAVRAGLDAVVAVGNLNIDGGVELQARAGIATGHVVVGDLVGDVGRDADAVSGETPNLAARLQEIAGVGQVAIGAATRRLIGEAFELENLGSQALKGFAEAVPMWRVTGVRPAESRFEAAHAGRLTAFVGREEEVDLLVRRWQQAEGGEGQIVLLSGEAGIGKSRITQTLGERIADQSPVRLHFQCSPHHANSALYPFISHLERASGIASADGPDARLDKLEELLVQSTEDITRVAPLFGALLSIPSGDRYPALGLAPQLQKERTLEALADQLLGLAARRPVLMVFEDVHWADPTTLEALELVIDRVQDARVLGVITHRPEFAPPWHGHSHVTALALNRLGRDQCAAMVPDVARGKPLPGEVLDQIVAKTDGVPLFVEELTKTVIESGILEEKADRFELSGPLPPLAIPSTLQDSLMARLDRLAPAKEVAQIGAAIGREFSQRLLAEVSSVRDNELNDALGQLVESELVFRRGRPPEVTFVFKHALLQDAAYQSLLRSKRQTLHRDIAGALEESFPETAETEPEILAHHFTEAGVAAPAVNYWQQAGRRAIERSANEEAIAHLDGGLKVLEALPESADRVQKEIALRVALGVALINRKGSMVPEVEQNYLRARALCEDVDDTQQLFPVVWGLWFIAQQRTELRHACELADQLLAIDQLANDSTLRIQAHHCQWTSRFLRGELPEALEHAEQGMALYRADEHHTSTFTYGGHDPGVCSRIVGATVLWLLGYPEQASERHDAAFALASELRHPETLVEALEFGMQLSALNRDGRTARLKSEAVLEIATANKFTVFDLQANAMRGWALVVQGEVEAGLALMPEPVASLLKHHLVGNASYLSLVAMTWGRHGMAEEGLALVTEALTLTQRNDERWWEAELHRVKGELLLTITPNTSGEAEACFNQALDIARKQSAKSLELRAATSITRLWQEQGKLKEARDLLAPVYDWFTEGFDTADLKDAKALLDELT